ncbi:MAG: BBP7 family outer membrane beta-barrel protein [Gemmataceae bacterium]|nr:BBP7 family outer membrane beta-barrel protein [Gemmataceae bacterium]
MNSTCARVIGLVLGLTPVLAPTALAPTALAQQAAPPIPEHPAAVAVAPAADINCCDPSCCARFYGRAEYLHWWIRDAALPPLVTTGNANDARPGALGFPATRVVLGGSDLDQDGFNGGRFTLGSWLRRDPTVAVEATAFFLSEQDAGLSVASSGAAGSPVLSRPFFDVVNNVENADPVALPFVQGGAVDVNLESRLWGFEVNLRKTRCEQECRRIQVLAGFRFLDLDETLRIAAATQDLAAGAGNRALVVDEFAVRNRFYGGQVGIAGEWRRGQWVVDAQAKVALGCTDQRQNVSGFRTIEDQTSGAVRTFPAGLLAQPSNSGAFEENEFAVVPELTINLGYQICPRARAFVGYTLLYWSEVARPGQQIDRVINTTQFPPGNLTGPARPTTLFDSTDFWAQGVNVGFEIRY